MVYAPWWEAGQRMCRHPGGVSASRGFSDPSKISVFPGGNVLTEACLKSWGRS